MIFNFNFSTDFFIILALFLISMSYSAIVHYNYSFLHLLLIYELIFLSICLFFSVTGYITDQIDGDIIILFIIGIIAAETAIGISFYINTLIGNNFYDNDLINIQKKKIKKEKNIIFYQNIKSVLYKKDFLCSVIVSI
jgi:NADH:ubiquinone oxidoreductase subunit K